MKGLDIPKYDLEWVKGKIHTMREVVIPPFGATIFKGIVNLTTHTKCWYVAAELVMGYSENTILAKSYGVLKLGRGKIDLCLRNHSAMQIVLPKQTAVREITAANLILALLALKPIGHGVGEKEATGEKKKTENQKELLDNIDLTGVEEWSQNEQKEAWELLIEYGGNFAMSDMDLGKTSLVKHSIRLTDNTLFKELY